MKIAPTNFLYALSKIRQRQYAFLEAALAARGVRDVPPSYGDVLFVLDRHGPLPLHAIARLTRKDKSTVSTVVKHLAKAGYVSKKKGDDDGRFVSIALTRKAARLRPIIWDVSAAMNEGMFRGLSDREKTSLFRLVGRVYDNVVATAD